MNVESEYMPEYPSEEPHRPTAGDGFPKLCTLCPRQCRVNRQKGSGQRGFCGVPDTFVIARAAPHTWEEPPISGTNGSGAVFFSGCNLRCIFCQNRSISRGGVGREVSESELTDCLLRLQERGVHNINLVTPTHYTASLARLLEKVKPKLHIPVVWNSGGYESPSVLRTLSGLVDIYLPDFKYCSSELSEAYSGASDYAERATEALTEMYRQTGKVQFDAQGLMKKGLLVRHLILPGCRADSIAVFRHLAEFLPVPDVRVSVMRQYTPEYALDTPYPNLHRRLTEFEYRSVVDEVERLGFDGYMQGKGASEKSFTPDFSEESSEIAGIREC